MTKIIEQSVNESKDQIRELMTKYETLGTEYQTNQVEYSNCKTENVKLKNLYGDSIRMHQKIECDLRDNIAQQDESFSEIKERERELLNVISLLETRNHDSQQITKIDKGTDMAPSHIVFQVE